MEACASLRSNVLSWAIEAEFSAYALLRVEVLEDTGGTHLLSPLGNSETRSLSDQHMLLPHSLVKTCGSLHSKSI